MQLRSNRCFLCFERRKERGGKRKRLSGKGQGKWEGKQDLESQRSTRGGKRRAELNSQESRFRLWEQPGAETVMAYKHSGGPIPKPSLREWSAGREHCHLHEDPAVTSDVPLDPFAMKTMPLTAETSTW